MSVGWRRTAPAGVHDGSTRTNVYDPASDVVGYTDENGSAFDNVFDVLGRKTTVAIDPASNVAGNPDTAVTGTIAQSFQFDGLSRMTFGRNTTGTFGVSGSTADCDCAFVRDSIDRTVEEPQTFGGDTRYVTQNAFTSYPATGFTFPNAREIGIGNDLLYRKNAINETTGGGSIAAWQFFGSRIATVTLGNGIVTTFMNDAGTNSAVQSAVPNPAWGSITTDHLGYDGAGRLIGKRHKLPDGSTLVGFTTEYDPSSNKLYERALHAESRSSLYATDSMDRLLGYQRGVLSPTVTDGWSGMSVDDWAGLTPDGWSAMPAGPIGPSSIGVLSPITLPNTNSQRTYNLDGLGNWRNTGYTPEGGSPALEVRTHNKLNQITAFGVAPASTAITYDHGNNPATGPGLSSSRGNGNIANDGARAYVWDALNRLITVNRVSDGLPVGAYAYDAIGRRVQRVVSNGGVTGGLPDSTSRYLLDGQQIVEELSDVDGTATCQYVWGQYVDELVQLKALTAIGPQPLAAGNYYLLSDLLYRSAALTDDSAPIVEAFDTDAYGNTLLFSGPDTDGQWFTDDDTQAAWSACRFVFTGREYDAENITYSYRTRHYIPLMGVFGSRDPEIYEHGPNAYELGDGNSTTSSDPDGQGPVGLAGWGPINPIGHQRTSRAGTPCTYIRAAFSVLGYATPEDCADAMYPNTCRIPVGPFAFWAAAITANALRAGATGGPVAAGTAGTVGTTAASVIAIAGTAVTAWNAGQWARQWIECTASMDFQGHWAWKNPGGWQCI